MSKGKRKLFKCPNCGGCGCDICGDGYITQHQKKELEKQRREPQAYLVKEGRPAWNR